jgi:hypothetical protein
MKFFTPELYLRFNDASDDEAEAAFDEWERAGRRFQRRYKKIESQLPEALRRFHDEQCLHDADWCGIAQLPTYTFPLNSPGVTIIASQENTLIPEFKNTLAILQYVITAPPVIEKPLEAKVFSAVQPIWLYDEIDLVEPGVFSHSILVSSGLVVTIQFREFRYHIAPLLAPSRNGTVEQAKPAAQTRFASA